MTPLARNLRTFQKIMQLVPADTLLILSGSTSLVLQGVDLEVHDIDIVTDEQGAKVLDNLLKDYCIKPLEYSGTDTYRSWYGKYQLDGCDVDVMGEFQYKLKNGNWSQPNHLHQIFHLDYQGVFIPVLSLAQEIQEYENVGRTDKVAKIKAAIHQTVA